MTVKLYKRSPVLKNVLLFILLTFFYLHILYSIHKGVSAVIPKNFFQFYKDNIYLVYSGIITFYFVYSAKLISKFFFLGFLSLFLYSGVQLFISNFDKLILIFNFIFLVIGFNFFLFLKLELEESIYRPSFHSLDVTNTDMHKIKINLNGKDVKNLTGHLSNWDSVSCFIQFNENLRLAKGPVGIDIFFKGNKFFQRGYVVTTYSNGVGIRFKYDRRKGRKSSHDWLDFYAIIHDMGLRPRPV